MLDTVDFMFKAEEVGIEALTGMSWDEIYPEEVTLGHKAYFMDNEELRECIVIEIQTTESLLRDTKVEYYIEYFGERVFYEGKLYPRASHAIQATLDEINDEHQDFLELVEEKESKILARKNRLIEMMEEKE